MTEPTDTPSAETAFVATKAEIDAMLTRLADLSADCFHVSPDAVNWGHVGTLQHYAELLRRITCTALGQG